MSNKPPLKDFLISYSSADRLWAEWFAWQLEQEGYSVVLQTWDFRSRQNFMQSMHDAIRDTKHTIAVLSPDYLNDLEKRTEWTAVLRPVPSDEQGELLPVQVRECRDQLKGLSSLLAFINLVGRNEEEARQLLLDGIHHLRSEPLVPPAFPEGVQYTVSKQPRFPASLPTIWHVPPRNPFFTDREEILQRLQASFAALNTRALTQSQAISGLGGVGKTQIAIEYAYRSVNDYQAVLWATADSHNALTTSCLNIAHQLDLPGKDAKDNNEIVSTVREWLQNHIEWLLILDNADDPYIVRDFLPSATLGHTLITTRAQAMGKVAQGMIVDKMMPEEGAIFLLRRAGMLGTGEKLDVTDPECQGAMHISEIMDGLPLALDQAGAYIEEVGCSMADYLALYKEHRKYLLRQRGKLIFDHPEPVATTWALSFEQVQQANPAAAGLLRLCAFLSPDDIPEEVFTEGTTDLGSELQSLVDNPLTINDALAELRRYSLIRRFPENKTLSTHRLVQTVLIDTMDDKKQRLWAERAVRALNHVFPEVKFETWKLCQRYLSHIQTCGIYIAQWDLVFPEAADLLRRAGTYLRERVQFAEAEKSLRQALAIYERIAEPDEIAFAQTLNTLAELYMVQVKYTEAERLYSQALTIFEHIHGSEHPDAVDTLNNLFILFYLQGRYAEAMPIGQRVLAISEKLLESDHPDTATSLNNLAMLYQEQGKYAEAEPLFQRALAIREQQLGAEHHATANSLNNLAGLYQEQGKYAEAEPLFQRALSIDERTFGSHHPEVANDLNSFASLYLDQGHLDEAEPLIQHAIAIRERVLGSDRPGTAHSLSILARLYTLQGKLADAEPLYRRALDIFEQVLGAKHPDTLKAQRNLASLLREMQRTNEAAGLEDRIRKAQGEDTEEQKEQ